MPLPSPFPSAALALRPRQLNVSLLRRVKIYGKSIKHPCARRGERERFRKRTVHPRRKKVQQHTRDADYWRESHVLNIRRGTSLRPRASERFIRARRSFFPRISSFRARARYYCVGMSASERGGMYIYICIARKSARPLIYKTGWPRVRMHVYALGRGISSAVWISLFLIALHHCYSARPRPSLYIRL